MQMPFIEIAPAYWLTIFILMALSIIKKGVMRPIKSSPQIV